MSKEKEVSPADKLLLDTGNLRDRALYWKPNVPGTWLIGKLIGYTFRTFERPDGTKDDTPTDIGIFEPAATFDPVSKTWTYVRAAQVVMSAALAQRLDVRGQDRGKVFAFRYDGTEPSTRGNETRLYTVVEQTRERFGEILGLAEA